MAGATVASSLARFPTHPLDTCKAKIQVQTHSASSQTHAPRPKVQWKPRAIWFGDLAAASSPAEVPYRGIVDTLRRVFAREGVRGLYQGFGTVLIGSAPAGCMYWTSYETAKIAFRRFEFLERNPSLSHFIAGLTAEAFSCLLFVPIDVIKERLQVQSSVKDLPESMRYRGNVHAFATVARQEGVRGIYRGYGATVSSFGPFSAFYLMFYERLKTGAIQILQKDSAALPVWAYASCGFLAGGTAAFITNPLDMSKLRIQVQRRSKHVFPFAYRHIVHGVVSIARQEGARALWKGAGARMAQAAPSGAINIALYESFKHIFFDWFEVPL
eukprot:129926_1